MKNAGRVAQTELTPDSVSRFCAECGSEVPRGRREAISGVRLCEACQEAQDRDLARFYNRSKGILLR
jgi:RNA polymerase-binding transcription factor DksA